jgi:hypothetical protein
VPQPGINAPCALPPPIFLICGYERGPWCLPLQARACEAKMSKFPSLQAKQQAIDALGLIPPEVAPLHRWPGHVDPTRLPGGSSATGSKRPPAPQVGCTSVAVIVLFRSTFPFH